MANASYVRDRCVVHAWRTRFTGMVDANYAIC